MYAHHKIQQLLYLHLQLFANWTLTLISSGDPVSSEAMGFSRLVVMLCVTMIHLGSGNLFTPVHEHLLAHYIRELETLIFFIFIFSQRAKCNQSWLFQVCG